MYMHVCTVLFILAYCTNLRLSIILINASLVERIMNIINEEMDRTSCLSLYTTYEQQNWLRPVVWFC